MATGFCVNCQASKAALDIRKRALCLDCFVRYVNSKVRKRMESYRFKNLPTDRKKRLLLPLSGGVSSLCLLQVLDAQLKEQMDKQNRTAYELMVVHVASLDLEYTVGADWYKTVAARFCLHQFLPPVKVYEAVRIDQELEGDLSHLGLTRRSELDDEAFYNWVLTSATSVTTRTDLQELLVRRMLVALAKQQNCDSILWGHSDSRLAAQALADVAKGRGGSVPESLADGPISEGVNFNYPMCDLFKSELDTYASALSQPLSPMQNPTETEPITSIRNTSIDNLLSNYIMSQGEKYPSIMANVVRTASKLEVLKAEANQTSCVVCRCSLNQRTRQNVVNESKICYGCGRMKQDIKGKG